jgi:hydroxymethylpyrimidine pyrophosphatase-like HAD family hydrolase
MTAPPIRLAAIDLDGTLINSAGQLSEGNAAALRRLQDAGVVVAAATARWPEAARRPFEDAGLPAAAIACAGADVVSADGAPVARWPLPPGAAEFVADLCERARWVANLSLPGVTYRLMSELPPWADRAPPWLRPVTTVAGLDLAGALSVLIEPPQGDPLLAELDPWRHRIAAHWALSSDGLRPMLTITALGVEKGRGLVALCDALGITPAEAAAFGDSEVDLPMFRVAGISVAMGNASSPIQDAATFVTLTADEDGFAAAVDRILAGD